MSQVTYAISWKTRDRRLIHKVCRYLNIPPAMSVNRVSHVGSLYEQQKQALQPLVQNGCISIYKFTGTNSQF